MGRWYPAKFVVVCCGAVLVTTAINECLTSSLHEHFGRIAIGCLVGWVAGIVLVKTEVNE